MFQRPAKGPTDPAPNNDGKRCFMSCVHDLTEAETARLTPMAKPELMPLNHVERSRTYHFPDGKTLTLKDVTHLLVRPSGTHRLMTKDGRKWIVPPGWLAVELDVDDWTL